MYIFRLHNNLTQSLLNDWAPYFNQALGNDLHPDRKKGYVFAREALRLALQDFKQETSIADIGLKGFSSLEKFPEFTLSLSHSKKAGAAVLGRREEFAALGIDIELTDREVKPAIVGRISNPKDELNLRNIELWCLKEAVFKCLMNTGNFNAPIEFSQILIEQQKWSHPSGPTGEWQLSQLQGHVVAIASLTVGRTIT